MRAARAARSVLNRRILSGGLFLGAALGPGSFLRADPGASVVVHPAETAEILANPGMGWETFGKSSRQDKNLPAGVPSTVLYARWGWGVLEPKPGQLNTVLLDGILQEAHASGQKLAFRVMCCSPYAGRPYHPAWLKDVGGRILVVDHRGVEALPVPDFDDPVILARHLDFIRRLGERYDGSPDLDHVDLGSIGWWGEWHMSSSQTGHMPTMATRMKIVHAYLAAFQRTPLLMLLNGEACTTYATQHGAGWRADSLGDLGAFSATWNHMKNGYPAWIAATRVADVWQAAPVAFEPPNGSVNDYVTKGWPLRWIFNYALACHGSYLNGGSAALLPDPEFRAELKRFLQRLGYRLVLKEARLPAQAAPGGVMEVSLQWQNLGSAPCYQPYRVAYRLDDGRGHVRVIVGQLTVSHWLPGSVAMFTKEFMQEVPDLPPGPVYRVSEAVPLPADLPAGNYTASLAVVGLTDERPAVRLAIAGRSPDGWYPLSRLLVAR